MKIRVESEQQLLDLAAEAIHVLVNLRHSTKQWEESYGVELKRRKKGWEERADKLIAILQILELKQNETIKIEISDNSEVYKTTGDIK